MSTLWVLGSLNVDETVRVPRLPAEGETVLADERVPVRAYGGKGGNQAVAAALAGARVRLLGALGDDAEGTAYRRRLAGLGIDTSLVATDPAEPTGRAIVLDTPDGGSAIVVVPGANAAYAPDAAALDTLAREVEPGDVLLVSLEVPVAAVERVVARVHDQDVRVVVNAAPFAPLPQHVVDRCDPVVVNEPEAMALGDAGLVPSSLLVTFGPRGVAWNGVETPALPVAEVVDPTGAGDAFVGTLAGRIAEGDPDDDALEAALVAAAECVQRLGAQRDGRVSGEAPSA